jgi:hypothetical protein
VLKRTPLPLLRAILAQRPLKIHVAETYVLSFLFLLLKGNKFLT